MENFAHCIVRHPFEPSLDRINCAEGYSASNTRLVCVAVNFGMNEWGEEVYRELARAAVTHGKVADLEHSNQGWIQQQQAMIQELEHRLVNGDCADQPHLEHVLAGHKATVTKGREALSLAARKAIANRKAKPSATTLSTCLSGEEPADRVETQDRDALRPDSQAERPK